MTARTFALLIAAVTLVGCGGDAPKISPLAATPMTGESVLRLPHGGGVATLLRPDLRTAIDYRIPGVPAIRRTLSASLEDKTVYAIDTLGRLVNLDLMAGRCCTQTVHAHAFAGTTSGEVFGFDSTRKAIRLSDRSLKTYRTAVIPGEVDLIRGPGTQVIAISHEAGSAQVIGDDGELRRIKIPTGEVTNTWYGELFTVVTPSGLQLIDPTGKRSPQVIAMRGTPIHAIFSPSGHRIYVAREHNDLVQVDRFSGSNLGELSLPGQATALRIDRSGRWLMARAGTSDSIWVIDAIAWKLASTIRAPWGEDLPAITAAKNLLIRRGKDVVAIDLSTPLLTEIAHLSGAAGDVFLPLAWVPKGSMPETPAVTVAATPATVSAPPAATGVSPTTAEPAPAAAAAKEKPKDAESGFFIQVSSSQNQDWAKALSQQLKDGGYPSRVLNPETPDQGYRVVVGPYATRDDADSVGKRLGRSYFLIPTGPGGG